MTEQEKYGMDQLLKYLEMQINLKSDRIRMYKKQMDSNYLYYFAWEAVRKPYSPTSQQHP